MADVEHADHAPVPTTPIDDDDDDTRAAVQVFLIARMIGAVRRNGRTPKYLYYNPHDEAEGRLPDMSMFGLEPMPDARFPSMRVCATERPFTDADLALPGAVRTE